MSPKFTAAQRKELSDEARESRMAYEIDMVDRRKRFDERAAKWRELVVTTDAAFAITGDVAEFATALGIAASNLDDDDLSKSASQLRQAATRVGNILTQRRRVYEREPAA